MIYGQLQELWFIAGIMVLYRKNLVHCRNFVKIMVICRNNFLTQESWFSAGRFWFTAGISLKLWLFAGIMVLCRNKVIFQLKTLKNNHTVMVDL